MTLHGVKILGTGSYTPEKVMTNADLEKFVDTTDEWIVTRTGIRERHIAADDEPTSALATQAARRALDAAGLTPDDLDLIVVATITPDKCFPNTACFVQQRLQAPRSACFSIEAACSGFVYGLDICSALLRTGRFKTALVIGAEKLSSIVNWKDRSTCVLFGDGAGAAILGAVPAEEDCYLAAHLSADGNHSDILHIPAGGSSMPISQDVLKKEQQYMVMSGKEVFKLAVNCMASSARAALEQAGIAPEQVRWCIPHQANTRIIGAVAKALDFPDDRVFINVHKYGNTSAASIPIALDEAVRSGQVDRGDYLLLVAFGGGLTWGANLIRY
jgi:3-oxoacyl-[acyl-carrier-protein] synthase-3